MTTSDKAGSLAISLRDAVSSVERLHAELLARHPVLRGNMGLPGMFVGYGLGSMVTIGMTNDQIIAHVMSIIADIRHEAARRDDSDEFS